MIFISKDTIYLSLERPFTKTKKYIGVRSMILSYIWWEGYVILTSGHITKWSADSNAIVIVLNLVLETIKSWAWRVSYTYSSTKSVFVHIKI